MITRIQLHGEGVNDIHSLTMKRMVGPPLAGFMRGKRMLRINTLNLLSGLFVMLIIIGLQMPHFASMQSDPILHSRTESDAMFKAILSKNIAQVTALLDRGADPNSSLQKSG